MIQNEIRKIVKIIMGSGVISRVAAIKFEIDIIVMREEKGEDMVIGNYRDLVGGLEEKMTTPTRKTMKADDEAEEEVIGLLAVSCSFSGPGVLLKNPKNISLNFHDIDINVSALPNFLCLQRGPEQQLPRHLLLQKHQSHPPEQIMAK